MDVYWLEQTESDVPPNDDWLSAAEAARLAGMPVAKRRADWRLGRWTAKRAIARCLQLSNSPKEWSKLEVRASASGAPIAYLNHEAVSCAMSLTHCSGRAMCAVAGPDAALGCDLEKIEPRSQAFARDYFTIAESRLIMSLVEPWRSTAVTLLWSLKESALKALGVGLRWDTRWVEVCDCDKLRSVIGLTNLWQRASIHSRSGKTFYACWQSDGVLVWTVAISARICETPALVRLINISMPKGRQPR